MNEKIIITSRGFCSGGFTLLRTPEETRESSRQGLRGFVTREGCERETVLRFGLVWHRRTKLYGFRDTRVACDPNHPGVLGAVPGSGNEALVALATPRKRVKEDFCVFHVRFVCGGSEGSGKI